MLNICLTCSTCQNMKICWTSATYKLHRKSRQVEQVTYVKHKVTDVVYEGKPVAVNMVVGGNGVQAPEG